MEGLLAQEILKELYVYQYVTLVIIFLAVTLVPVRVMDSGVALQLHVQDQVNIVWPSMVFEMNYYFMATFMYL